MSTIKYIIGGFRNPWRYPEFMEYGLALAAICQTLIAWLVFASLPYRPGLMWTIIVNPHTWASMGFILAALHLFGLWLGTCYWGYWTRMLASHLSCAFWIHFVGTTTTLAIVKDITSIATTTAPALVAPYAAFVVCVRLRKEWQ